MKGLHRILDYPVLTGLDPQAENMGGTTMEILFTPLRDIAAEATLSANPSTTADASLIIADHVFKTGKGWRPIAITMDSGEATSKLQGDIDGKSVINELKFFIPGLDPKTLGTQKLGKNDRFMFLAPMADGTYLQIGTVRFPAMFKDFNFSTAKNKSGVRGAEVVVESMEVSTILYEGLITPHP